MTRTLKTLLIAGLMIPCASWAAGLGELKVLSALGQPLRAEVDVVALKAGDSESLKARIAFPDAFKQAGVDYNPLLSGVTVTIAKHPDGQPYIALSSTQPVNTPFLDVLIDLSWASSQIEREYTMLFDPVEFAKTPAVSPPVALPERHVVAAPKPSVKAVAPKPVVQKPVEAKQAHEAKTLLVKKGMTLSGIAMATKPKGISLEQMLVALYRENSDAFVGKNMNRLIAGKVLNIPDSSAISSIDKHDAAKVVEVQAIDWNAYRQRLASYAVERKGELKRSVSGKITASVEQPAVAPQSKEVLKLGKGGKATVAEADKAANVKAMNDASERILTLEKNIQQMKKVLALKNSALAQKQTKPEPSFFDMSNPVLLGAAGGLVVGLAGIGILISRRRKKAVEHELPSAVEPEEMRPSLRQAYEEAPKEEAVRADPLEEAQLYLSYRRFDQAEQVLKEALQEEPGNFEAHLLLMKVFAASGNTESLEHAARALQSARPSDETWMHAMEIGHGADPGNPLYAGAASVQPVSDLAPKAENLDFDLDLSAEAHELAEEPVHAQESADIEPAAEEQAEEAKAEPEMVDFDLSSLEAPAEEQAEEAKAEPEMVDLSIPEAPEEEKAPAKEEEAFDLSDIPSLVATEAKPRQPEMAMPDVDLHLGDEPIEAAPKDQAWYEVATKLDLAKVYQEMGDLEGAREILGEVMNEGDSEQKSTAQAMLDSLSK
jgi:pilus assembly protein FimV